MVTIPSDYIGSDSGKIAILFNNGKGIVTGYIEKQTGSNRYNVNDGTDQFTVTLVKTLEEVNNLQEGDATIEIFPFHDGAVSTTPEHIHHLDQFTCYTVEGSRLGWRFAKAFEIGLGASANREGEGNISQLP